MEKQSGAGFIKSPEDSPCPHTLQSANFMVQLGFVGGVLKGDKSVTGA